MWQQSAPGLAPGDHVRVRGEGWRVERLLQHDDCARMDLCGVGRTNLGSRRSLLLPFDRPVRFAPRPHPRLVSRARWMRALRALLAGRFDHGQLRAPVTANIELFPHQLEPALAIVTGRATRLLLADEVGLGKTIQAGLVCAELRLRGLGDRILILTPAGLREQWAEELRHRFSIHADVVDATTLGRRVASLPQGLNPWTPPGVAIVSLDFAKHPEVLGPLAAIRWDVLVVDEAHGVASAPERARAARRLASHTRIVLLATATPHNGDHRAFASLCSVGRLLGEAPILLMRRSRSDVGLPRTRRTSILRVRLTDSERRMHRLLQRYVAEVWREAARRHDRGALLAMTVLWKRALSSADSLRVSAARRLELLDASSPQPWQAELPLVAGDAAAADLDSRDDVSPFVLAAPGLIDSRGERASLAAIVESAAVASVSESKVARLARLFSRINEPAIVFTEYRDTLEHLRLALDRHGPIEMIHGGLAAPDRRQACRRFSSGDARILLATDAAGEGLNLQRRCRLVVNIELPWNPMRLEQRAGRVDRLDQRRVPHIVHLVASDTAETAVLARLVRRLDAARSSIGAVDPLGAVREEELAGELLGISIARPIPGNGSRVCGDGRSVETVSVDLRDACAAEASRVGEARRALGRFTGGHKQLDPASLDALLSREMASIDGDGPFSTALRCRGALRFPAGFLCVCRARVIDASGFPIEESLLPVHVHGAAPRSRRSSDLRRCLSRNSATVTAAATEIASSAARARALSLEVSVRAAWRPMIDRAQAIAASQWARASLDRQPGLFDRTASPFSSNANAAMRTTCVAAAATDSPLTFEVDVPLIAVVPR